jgi:sugar lactone lactonase YvrE
MSHALGVAQRCAWLVVVSWGFAACATTPPTPPVETSPKLGAGETVIITERVPMPPPPPPPKPEISEVVSLGDKLATTAAVSRSGRVFINFPRWFKDNEAAFSVAELGQDGALTPFPDAAWNSWKLGANAGKKLVCVQSVFVDAQDRLWVLDTGAPYWGETVKRGPKLVAVDLQTNKVAQIVRFDAKIAPENSYLNDVRIDPNGQLAYLTDSNLGRLIVVDLKSGKSRLALQDHASTKFEQGVVPVVENVPLQLSDGGVFKIHVDGIAIAGDDLYYHAWTARTLYRIKLDLLRDPTKKPEALEAGVEKVAETGVHDGMAADADGNLYLTQLEDNAITVLSPDGKQSLLLSDPRLQWPDSIGVGPDGLYVTVSQLHLLPAFNGGASRRKNPYRVFRIKPGSWAALSTARQNDM